MARAFRFFGRVSLQINIEKCFKRGLPVCISRQRYCSTRANTFSRMNQQPDMSEQFRDSHFEASDPSTLDVISQSMYIYNDFISAEEESVLVNEIEPQVKRLKYEGSHWDDAIHGYREIERNTWSNPSEAIIRKVRDLAFGPGVAQIAHVHCLDLEESGHIKPHVDSVRFCGDTIAGLSLLSECVMKLVHEKEKEKWVKIFLRRRSLYIMTGAARYDFTHEILPNSQSLFKSLPVKKTRRISVMCRNEPV
ncbi:alpha-ketoglutarate-dependent dioxygenase alkB homolog 7, mitochondrial-like [Ornithodoros turicata]|uniref:alpha-ketoglutarate-dependent dioxygenase alkB homolog 7, mitochondrial-like n=1 Tax=Ornithodoros turicata TaxID=34597 RepID=UPI00313A460F